MTKMNEVRTDNVHPRASRSRNRTVGIYDRPDATTSSRSANVAIVLAVLVIAAMAFAVYWIT